MSIPRIIKKADNTILIERFPPIRRIEHLLVIATFVVLVITGFPQKFYEAAWAGRVLTWIGGLDNARLAHRIAGLVFCFHVILHVGVIVVGVLTSKMRLSLLPTSQDFRDVMGSLKYYFGYAPKAPKYPKFDYRQKFEYLGIVLGGFVMVLSGLALLYPAATVAWLPGQVIPAARVAHSNEALLALLVLTIWHVYGSHFSPEVFPMDKSIFTGFMTLEELEERHAREYERLVASGALPPSSHPKS